MHLTGLEWIFEGQRTQEKLREKLTRACLRRDSLAEGHRTSDRDIS